MYRAAIAGMTVLFECERRRIAVLHGVPKAMQRANTGIPAPGEDQLSGTAHPDQLVVDHVRCHPDQSQVPPLLANDLMSGGKRDEMGEAFHGDGGAVGEQVGYRIVKSGELGHSIARH